MPRLLLLMTTTTYKAEAFLQAASAVGIETVVGTDRRQVLASLHPEGNLTLDFADLDLGTRQIVDYAARHPVAAVVAADDDGAVLAARAARALGLRHHPVEAVAATRDKWLQRRAFAAATLHTPRCVRCSADAPAGDVVREVEAHVGYPCVVKPRALAASRGVIRADDAPGLVVAFERSRDLLLRRDAQQMSGAVARSLLVESFIPGFEVAVEGLLTSGVWRTLAVFDKPDPLDGPYFQETIYVTPSRHPETVQRDIEATVARAAAALGLRHGPVHAELRYNGSGAWMLEVAARSIGGQCGRVLRFGDGMSQEELLVRHALGEPTAHLGREARAAGVLMIPIPCAGTLRRVGGVEAARGVGGVEDVRITIPPGQHVEPPPEGSRYLGFVFARGASPQSVEGALRLAHAALDVDIEATRATPAPAG